MATTRRLKRKVLREAVEENLDLLTGVRRRRRRRSRRVRRIAILTVPLLLLGASTYFLSRALAAPEGVAILAPPTAAPQRSAPVETSAPRPESAMVRLPAPEPIEPSVLRLEVRRIVLDPGHGGTNVGTVAPGGLQEKELTLDVSQRLRLLLEKDGYEVLMTRSEDENIALNERTRFANEERADLFVSIHVNWIEAAQIRGVETYYLGASEDPYINAIAAAENTGSHYSLADFRQLMEGIYTGVRQQESKALAGSIQKSLLHSLRRVNPQLRDRGVKTAPFVVLVSSEMPAVLVEVSCLSNEEEARLLRKPYYRQYIAEALAAGIDRYAASLAPEVLPPTPEAGPSAESGEVATNSRDRDYSEERFEETR